MTIKEVKERQILERRQRTTIKGINNRLLSRFSLREVKTWEDVYRTSGYGVDWIAFQKNKDQHVTIQELRVYCKELETNLEKEIKKFYEHDKTEVPCEAGASQTLSQESKGNVSVGETGDEAHISLHNQHKLDPNIVPITQDIPKDESGIHNTADYGLPVNPLLEEQFQKSKSFLFWFQKKAVKESLDLLLGFDTSMAKNIDELTKMLHDTKVKKDPKSAILVIASTGTGKTFIDAAIDRYLMDLQWAEERTWGHIKHLAVTRNSVVEQTKRVYKEHFGIDPIIQTEVINIEKLRTRAGQIWLREDKIIVDGEEVTKWVWKPMINPAVLKIDECQAVKNPSSTQSQVISAFSSLPNTITIFISATPFTRVSEARAFAIATKKDISHLGFPVGTKLSADTWHTYAATIAHPSPPDEYNEAAVDRLMTDLKDYVVRAKGVRWQFNHST